MSRVGDVLTLLVVVVALAPVEYVAAIGVGSLAVCAVLGTVLGVRNEVRVTRHLRETKAVAGQVKSTVQELRDKAAQQT